MKTGAKGLLLLKSTEKCVLKAYLPTVHDRWTYGWGATFKKDGSPVVEGDTITQEEADELLSIQLIPREESVIKRLKNTPSQNQFDALVDLIYNASTGYKDKNGTYHDWDLWHNINEGMSQDDLTKYWSSLAVTQGGVKLNGLVARRINELNLYFSKDV